MHIIDFKGDPRAAPSITALTVCTSQHSLVQSRITLTTENFMRFRSTKASGSFDCTKRGAFELLVHMEADPHCCSYAELDFKAVLPSYIAHELGDVAAYTLRHTAGRYVVCAQPSRADRSSAFRYCWVVSHSVV